MRSLPGTLTRGVVAGLVAGLLLTTLQALARLLIGVAPPAELVGDRVAPLLTIDQFFGLFATFGGYNQLKQAGILGGTGGQLAVGVVIAVVVALVARRSARRGFRLLAILTGILFLGAVAVLWPILGTNFAGIAPGAGRLITIAFMAVSFGLLGVTIGLVLWLLGGVARTAVVVEPAEELVTVGGGGGGELPAVPEPPATPPGSTPIGRRALLVGGGVGIAGVGLAAATAGMGTKLYDLASFSYDGTRVFGPNITPITPNDKFYTVTKNVIDPRVNADRWSFSVDGAVNSAQSWDYATLRAMPQITQETTLMCISNGVGDGLMSNAMWTGVRLADLISAAGPSKDTVEVLLTAVDGYSDTFAIAKAMDPTTLLAFGMNGVDLPQRHGYPARLVVPGMFGEKNLKWITKVELVTEETKGFYETQGWGPNFVTPTRSTIMLAALPKPSAADAKAQAKIVGRAPDAQVRRGDTTVVSGTAFGGDRGVSRVEVSTDGGGTWTDARITYPGTRLSWALWSYDWTPTTASFPTLAVRATDGTGTVQTSDERGIIPMGATGYHKLLVAVV